MIKEYKLKDGTIRYMYKGYYGQDPLTGKGLYLTKRGFKTEKEAEIAEARLKVQLDDGTYSAARKQIKFRDLYEEWYEVYKRKVRESTLLVKTGVYKNIILPAFGDRYLHKITIQYCEKVAFEWADEYVDFSSYIAIVARILDRGVRDKYITTNPMRLIERPEREEEIEEEDTEDTFYDKDELNHFMDCVKSTGDLKYIAMFQLLAYTGVRKGEVLSLVWGDLDEVNQTLSIRRSLGRGIDKKFKLQPPKNKSSRRKIKLDDETMAVLQEWRLEQKERMLMLGHNTSKRNQFIFSNKNNKFESYNNPNYKLDTYIKKFNLKQVTIHSFRHSHCSLLFEAGATLQQVQDRLGHANPQTTLKVYSHVTKKQKEEVADLFADFMAEK